MALIITEFITNVAKYAYPDRESTECHVWVHVNRLDEDLKITVRDKETGLPDGFKLAKTNSLGMRIALALAKQIGAHLTGCNAEPGAEFILSLTQAASETSGKLGRPSEAI